MPCLDRTNLRHCRSPIALVQVIDNLRMQIGRARLGRARSRGLILGYASKMAEP